MGFQTKLCYVSTFCFIILMLNLPPALPNKPNPLPVASALLSHYEALYQHYSTNHPSDDCKLEDSNEPDEIAEHRHWGTITTLQFLIEKLEKPTHAEQLMNLEHFRAFLARVGYLKDPGSLVFLDKQAITLRLSGCPEGSGWRLQGEKDEDMAFQTAHKTGGQIRTHCPNPYNYVHKYTCFSLDKKCSHTFYTITKQLPEVPLGLQVREGSDIVDNDAFSCGVSFCNIKDCYMGAAKIPRRSYPPYNISWIVPQKLAKAADGKNFFTKEPNQETSQVMNTGVRFAWHDHVKPTKEATVYSEKATDAEWINGFGENLAGGEYPVAAFHSVIEIKNAMSTLHSGLYECVIMDGNGVVSRPNQPLEELTHDYLGDANIHVMPRWQIFGTLGATAAFLVLTLLVILICPKKLEHDDGTPYKKDEMVHPVVEVLETPSRQGASVNPSVMSSKMEATSGTAV